MTEQPRPGLGDIIGRLESATEADRELDAMIHWQILEGVGTGYNQDAPAYTGSIDAAKTLLRPNEFEQVWSGTGTKMSSAQLVRHRDSFYRGPSIYARAATEPIALCIAALKARARQPAS